MSPRRRSSPLRDSSTESVTRKSIRYTVSELTSSSEIGDKVLYPLLSSSYGLTGSYRFHSYGSIRFWLKWSDFLILTGNLIIQILTVLPEIWSSGKSDSDRFRFSEFSGPLIDQISDTYWILINSDSYRTSWRFSENHWADWLRKWYSRHFWPTYMANS